MANGESRSTRNSPGTVQAKLSLGVRSDDAAAIASYDAATPRDRSMTRSRAALAAVMPIIVMLLAAAGALACRLPLAFH